MSDADLGALELRGAERGLIEDDDVRELFEQAGQRGFVTSENLDDLGDETDLAADDLARLRDVLKRNDIPFVELSADPVRTAERDVGGPLADSVRLYLDDVGRVQLLDAVEEVDLAKRMEAGRRASALLAAGGATTPERRARLRNLERDGARATTSFLEANLRLVVSIAKRYTGRGLSMPDLIQEGNLGLIRAVEKFDYRRGYKFSTYATWWIRQMISRGIADQSRVIRVPVHLIELMNKIRRVERELVQELGRDPEAEELAAAVGVTVGRLEELDALRTDAGSLDAPVGEDGSASLSDLVEDPEAVMPAESAAYLLLRRQLDEVLDELAPRERLILDLRFGRTDGRVYTLEEVGEVVGLTRERVRQIEARALARLRLPMYTTMLAGYLED